MVILNMLRTKVRATRATVSPSLRFRCNDGRSVPISSFRFFKPTLSALRRSNWIFSSLKNKKIDVTNSLLKIMTPDYFPFLFFRLLENKLFGFVCYSSQFTARWEKIAKITMLLFTMGFVVFPKSNVHHSRAIQSFM